MSNGPYVATLASGVPIPGSTGPRGPQGERGQTGAQGPTGFTGPMGPQGNTGPMGPTGPQGPMGPQGQRGFTGARGPQGEPSAAWQLAGAVPSPAELPVPTDPGTAYYVVSTNTIFAYDGQDWLDLGMIQGPTGPVGPEGAEGPRGDSGPAGPAGPMGPTGPAGPQGSTGQQGPIGQGIQVTGVVSDPSQLPSGQQSGTVYYVSSNGSLYVWETSLASWVDMGMVSGPPGPQGQQGIQGNPGPQGEPGTPGQMQTPWVSDQDASGHRLDNVEIVRILGPQIQGQGGPLFVKGQDTGAYVNVDTTSPVGYSGIQFRTGGVYQAEWGAWQNSLACWVGPGANAAMTITPTGVGIGASPEAKLQVSNGRTLLQFASDPWVLGLQSSGSPNITWLGTDASGSLRLADASGITHFMMSWDGRAVINNYQPFDPAGSHLQVQGGISVSGFDDAGISQLRIVYGPYGVFFRNDGQTLTLSGTDLSDPWGGGKYPVPMTVDLASHIVGIRVAPNPSYGLAVDSLIVSGGLAAGGVTVNDLTANGTANVGALTVNNTITGGGQGLVKFFCREMSVDTSQLPAGYAMFSQVNTGVNQHGLLIMIRHANGQLYEGSVSLAAVAG